MASFSLHATMCRQAVNTPASRPALCCYDRAPGNSLTIPKILILHSQIHCYPNCISNNLNPGAESLFRS
jgi:hypothetical protein